MVRKSQICYIQSLPAETLCSILKAALENIVEDDMTTNPRVEHRVLEGGLPFPHTMALVCRHWRDIVSSAPELWTRIFCVLPQGNDPQMFSSQLKKTGTYPIYLTIINHHHCTDEVLHIFRCIAPHIGQLRSFRIHDQYVTYTEDHFNTLTGYAPQLECLHFCSTLAIGSPRFLKIDCPNLRNFCVDLDIASVINHQWLKDNLTYVESMTISPACVYDFGDRFRFDFARALRAVPRRIPCLTLDSVRFTPQNILSIRNAGIKIRAEKVIIRSFIEALAVIDDDCKTVVLQRCNTIEDLRGITLSATDTLEFDSMDIRSAPNIPIWDGHTVTVRNSKPLCMKAIFVFLGAPFRDQICFQWPRVTTLELIAKGDFVMKFPFQMLKAMISSRREAAGHKNLGKDDEELDSMEYKGVRPIMVLHVHGGPALSHKERAWFEERVGDFVWDYKKR